MYTEKTLKFAEIPI